LAERSRVGTSVAECAGTWGLVQRSVFMRLVSRRVPRQSHRVEFARACVRFLKKKRKNPQKDSTVALYLFDKTNATKKQGGGWTRGGFCGKQRTTSNDDFARQSFSLQSERTLLALISESSFSKRQRPGRRRSGREKKQKKRNEIGSWHPLRFTRRTSRGALCSQSSGTARGRHKFCDRS